MIFEAFCYNLIHRKHEKRFSFYFDLVTDCQIIKPKDFHFFISKYKIHEAKNAKGSYTWNALGTMVHSDDTKCIDTIGAREPRTL